jgi:hypothetical protein
MNDWAAQVVMAMARDTDNKLFDIGVEIGKIYTDHGLPIDMALDRLQYPKEQKIAVLVGAQNWMVQHRRNSNATDKAIERMRKANVETMHRFITTGETGIY